MKHDNHGCARMVFGGLFVGLTLLVTFFLLFTIGFRAEPAELPPAPDGAATLVVHEPGPGGWESVETSSDGESLTTRSRYRTRGMSREELRLVWRSDDEVDPELSGVFDTSGERLRGLTGGEVRKLEGWRAER